MPTFSRGEANRRFFLYVLISNAPETVVEAGKRRNLYSEHSLYYATVCLTWSLRWDAVQQQHLDRNLRLTTREIWTRCTDPPGFNKHINTRKKTGRCMDY
jgi:hypothetical protein